MASISYASTSAAFALAFVFCALRCIACGFTLDKKFLNLGVGVIYLSL